MPLAAKNSRIYPAFFSKPTRLKLSSVTLAKYRPSAPRYVPLMSSLPSARCKRERVAVHRSRKTIWSLVYSSMFSMKSPDMTVSQLSFGVGCK